MKIPTFKPLSLILLFVLLFQVNLLYSQDNTDETPEEIAEVETTDLKEKGKFNFYVNNNLIFLLSFDGGFGFGETLNFQYTTPFNLAFGLEAGYYGAKSETDIDNSDDYIIGGFSLIPLYAVAEFNFKLIENFYISPVIKFGVAYTSARLNGWIGGSAFSMVFEGGVRAKAFLNGGFLIQGNVCFGGLIEKSGIISMINVGLGFGF